MHFDHSRLWMSARTFIKAASDTIVCSDEDTRRWIKVLADKNLEVELPIQDCASLNALGLG